METTFPSSTNAMPDTASSRVSTQNFVDRLAQSAHQAVDAAAARAKPAIERAQESTLHARDAIAQKTDSLSTLSTDMADTVRDFVRERPLTVLIGAIAVGAILASTSRTR